MVEAANKFLDGMLDRLYAALSSGPNLNCRPHTSRQRIDFHSVAQLGDLPSEDLLVHLFLDGKVAIAAKSIKNIPDQHIDEEKLTAGQKTARRVWLRQQAVQQKLRTIAEDALTFQQDTGAHVLHVGFPLLNLAPGRLSAGRKGSSKRVLAPLAFVPVHLTVSKGRTFVELNCAGEKVDRVVPNTALLTWIQRQTGKHPDDIGGDEPGDDPYREINALMAYVTGALGLPTQPEFGPSTPLVAAPRSDEEEAGEAKVLPVAVLGLFPFSNQSLIDDMEAIVAGEPLRSPADSFVRADPTRPDAPAPEVSVPGAVAPMGQRFAEEYLVAAADPCQARAVRLAREAEMLVVHGPPGTGKSQTIANMIGDHLACGQRVLLVCDKRIALDVVYYRLDRLGLGKLCAVVHDAHSDQRELYRGVREQLDGLVESQVDEGAAAKLKRATSELQKLHGELTEYTTALRVRPEAAGMSFHELMGAWLGQTVSEELQTVAPDLRDVPLHDGETHEKAIREILQRGQDCAYAVNPWTAAAGVELSTFLARPMDQWRQVLASTTDAATQTDATVDPAIAPFPADGDLMAVGRFRMAFGETLAGLFAHASPERLAHWAKQDAAKVRQAKTTLGGHARFLGILRQGPLDAELLQIHKDEPLKGSQIAPLIVTLDAYLATASHWYAFFCFGKKSAAALVLQRFGLTSNPTSAVRLRTFLDGIRARLALIDCHDGTLAPAPLINHFDDGSLQKALDDYAAILEVLDRLETEAQLVALTAALRQAILEPAQRESLLRGLQLAAPRSTAIVKLQGRLAETGLFAKDWLSDQRKKLSEGQRFVPVANDLASDLGKLEGILRIRNELALLQAPLASAVVKLLGQSPETDQGWHALHKSLLAAEISRRLRAQPFLQSVDGDKLRASFERYRVLDERRKTLVCATIQAAWVGKQRERLLVGTGSRLSSSGAELGRRLMLRGKRAMRLRQVIKSGGDIEGGDPLFDMRPVWMAGPSTVAELFPRMPLFDLVIFDEASQCRLEEALPVLMRGKRVVIAGDPKQLPPTRFFEAGVSASEDDEPRTDQDLFEAQQVQADDLLTAALNLAVERSYLDVHYRSHNADLIDFSNRNFYEARLQPIPGHPSHKPFQAPIRLHRVDGIYENRVNEAEAVCVVKLVRELLKRAEPPSIGIACFNITQRDQIVDALDEAAAQDAEFARRLAEARNRKGTGSFEGLFVRNLENVQGDERDYMIVSTTYGPDKSGKFYRRFGPLGSAGGGRRLNVLVTRARDEVHLVTSIPAQIYRALPPVPPGGAPNGGWLLFSYLNFAEQLERLYEEDRRRASDHEHKPGEVRVRPSEPRSLFAEALAEQLAKEKGLSSTVNWGNDGFCVDIALQHPLRPDDVTIGILCDGSRFTKATDLVEWDIFRTAILEGQGWKLHRIWTPHFVRDAKGSLELILGEARRVAEEATGD